MEPVKDHQGMKIIGIDNGYGNIKTANCCFPAGLTVHGAEPVFKDDLLVYDGRYYLIGTGHKEFKADKTGDDDYYILTLAAIARELNVYGLTDATVYVRYADDFLIGVIGSKADARQVKIDVGMFIREQLHLELSQEKTLITHGTDFAQFLSFQITTSKEQNSTRTKAGYVKRSYTGRIKLYVPKEKWLKRLLSYGALKIHYDKDNGNKEIWEPVCRSSLRNLDDLEILNQYNAEIRGLYNYYRIAHNATVLNNFLYVMKYSMYKTFAGKYRTSMQKIIRKYTKGKDFVVTYQSKSGEKSVVFYNQGMRRDTHVDATNPDIIGRANENRSYTSLVQRLKGGQCEWCGATDVEIEIHHIRKLKDLSGKAEWERHMIARRRKTMALCHNCHVKLHAGKLD